MARKKNRTSGAVQARNPSAPRDRVRALPKPAARPAHVHGAAKTLDPTELK